MTKRKVLHCSHCSLRVIDLSTVIKLKLKSCSALDKLKEAFKKYYCRLELTLHLNVFMKG